MKQEKKRFGKFDNFSMKNVTTLRRTPGRKRCHNLDIQRGSSISRITLSDKKLDPKITSKLSVPFGDIELKTKWAYWPVLAATEKIWQFIVKRLE
jgi:hypothetical protein